MTDYKPQSTSSGDFSVYTLASGSTGNAIYVKSGETELLFDAGISKKRIETALNALGSSLSNISAIFVTHEHSDHVCALDMLAKHYKKPIYITEPSAKALLCQEKCSHAAACAVVESGEFDVTIGSLNIRSFATPHDSAASVGYVIDGGCPARTAAIATDIGHITPEIESALTGVETVILESNHDVNMLLSGPYSYPLKCRILSDYGHLSNEAAANFALRLSSTGTKRILLAHLSRENNFPDLALETTRSILPPDIHVSVAAPDHVSLAFSWGKTF